MCRTSGCTLPPNSHLEIDEAPYSSCEVVLRQNCMARTHTHRAGFLCQPSMNSSCEAQETSAKGSVLRADVKGGKFSDKAGNLQLKATTCTKNFHT